METNQNIDELVSKEMPSEIYIFWMLQALTAWVLVAMSD